MSPRGENNDYFNSRQGLECNKPRIREAIAQAKRFLALRTARPKLEANIVRNTALSQRRNEIQSTSPEVHRATRDKRRTIVLQSLKHSLQ